MPEPAWLAKARSYIGTTEIPGKGTSTRIAGWLEKLKAPWRDDETAWCGTFVAACFKEVGISPVNGWAGARNWLDFGVKCDPTPGAVVVFWRGSPKGWSGHVGFVVGKTNAGLLMVIGGNQGNAVSLKPFVPSRVLGYRWPTSNPPTTPLPVMLSTGKISTDEA